MDAIRALLLNATIYIIQGERRLMITVPFNAFQGHNDSYQDMSMLKQKESLVAWENPLTPASYEQLRLLVLIAKSAKQRI